MHGMRGSELRTPAGMSFTADFTTAPEPEPSQDSLLCAPVGTLLRRGRLRLETPEPCPGDRAAHPVTSARCRAPHRQRGQMPPPAAACGTGRWPPGEDHPSCPSPSSGKEAFAAPFPPLYGLKAVRREGGAPNGSRPKGRFIKTEHNPKTTT